MGFTELIQYNPAKTDAASTVKRPQTTIDRLLIAPSSSPISRARTVPIACAAAPMAKPTAAGSLIRNKRQSDRAQILPKIPVTIIAATVNVGIPPSSPDRAMPIAVVIDLGNSETYCSCDRQNRADNSKIEARLDNTPASVPVKIARQFFFRRSYCSYRGIAKQTVAGVKKYVIYSAP